MLIGFDNTFLALALNPNAKAAINPDTGHPATHASLRVEALIDEASKQNDTILIPTPCMAELLTVVPDMERAVSVFDDSSAFELASFDSRCAIEYGKIARQALDSGDKRAGSKDSWQKVKFDRQIVVIAKVHNVVKFYTDDRTQALFARTIGLDVRHTWDLDLPASHAQHDFKLDPD